MQKLMNAPITHTHTFNTDEVFDSSLFNLCIPSSMISNNKKEDKKNDPRWMEAQEDTMFGSADTNILHRGAASSSPAKTTKGGKKNAKGPGTVQKYKKAPDAPRRFKSAFIFFSIEKHRLIRESLQSGGQKEKTTNVAKMVSEAWKGLSKDERQVWDEKARKDRARYEVEVANYKGPWKVPAKRAKKPSDAPKRPMSAFLSFSNKRRMEAMRNNPDLSQAEISALLSKMWNEAPKDIREEYVGLELVQREQYKKDIALWREKDKEQKLKQRAEREANALKMAESSERDPLAAQEAAASVPSRSRLAASGLQKPPADFASSSEDFSLNRVMAQQAPQSSLSYAQNVARIARQQETLQQLSSVYLRQQETLQNLILANMTTNLGRPQQSAAQPISLSNNLGLHNQMNISMESRNLQQQLHHLGVASSMESGLNLAAFNQGEQQQQQQGDGGMDEWDDFAMGE